MLEAERPPHRHLRPALYDLEALAEALRSGTIAGAQLQIVPDDDSPLWDIENLIISFHRVVSRETRMTSASRGSAIT